MQANYLDPFATWKSLYTEMEPKISEGMQKWLESEEYAAISGQMLSTTLQAGQMFLKTFEQIMQTNNIPTTKDIARICEMLITLEDKVDRIDERLIQLEKCALHNAEVREQLNAIGGQLEMIGKFMSVEEIIAGKREAAPRSRRRTAKAEGIQEEPESGDEPT